MNRPNEIPQADRQQLPCQRFEQQLDACLDGRRSISSLVSDPHLEGCSDCRVSFDIYRQFDRAGGTVLNGGARQNVNSISRFQPPHRRWFPLTSAALGFAAALMIIVVATLPREWQSTGEVAAIDAPPSNLVTETSVMSAQAMSAQAMSALQSFDFAKGDPSQLSNANDVNELQSAAEDTRRQPTVEQFCEVGTISHRFLSRSMVSPLSGSQCNSWQNPWQYTSELPGIRPFHRSVNVALVLYNDSMTVL